MKIKKKIRFIEIYTEDAGEYTDIALLVDNKYFLEEVEKVRKKFNLSYDYPVENINEIRLRESEVLRDYKTEKKFDSEVERIRKMFNRPPHFSKTIKASIISGAVGVGDYSKAYLEEQEINPSKNPYLIADMKYYIVIHSGTRKKDVLRAFNEFREKVRVNFRGTEKERSEVYHGYWFDPSLAKIGDTKNSIQQISNWYRRRVNGESPLKMALKKCKTSLKQYKEYQHIIEHVLKYSEQEFDDAEKRIKKVEKSKR